MRGQFIAWVLRVRNHWTGSEAGAARGEGKLYLTPFCPPFFPTELGQALCPALDSVLDWADKREAFDAAHGRGSEDISIPEA